MTYISKEQATHGGQSSWTQIARRKQALHAESLSRWSEKTLGKPLPSLPPPLVRNVRHWPLESGDLGPKEIEITESCPSRILHMIADAIWTAEEVLLAFAARAIIAQHLTNPITQILFEMGIEQARKLDMHLAKTGSTVGPLHGLPISLKDVMNIRGYPTTLGFITLADSYPDDSDQLVDKLAEAGAVFYCKTNVPQGLMSGECTNLLYGRTSTPDNRDLSAGGSSGGEGSLVALGGSPLGIGTDILGSIRTPANFNGIYGLCPSHGRLPAHSAKYSSPSYINAVAGPLCRSIDGLEVYTKTLLFLNPWEWDTTIVRMPWDESAYQDVKARGARGDLCFGFIQNDGIVRPHPPIERGMREVKEALRAAGHQVVDVDMFDGNEGLEKTAMAIINSSGGAETRGLLARLPEPAHPETIFPKASDALTAGELLREGKALLGIRQRFLDKWMGTRSQSKTGRPVDVFILPSGGHVAPPHGMMEYMLYEAISNILDWTCATIPVGRVDPELDPKPVPEDNFVPMSEWDRRNWERYYPETYANGAICLQVLGQRFTEEKVLASLGVIEQAMAKQRGQEPALETTY